jgi:hypothetical protein
LVVEKIGIFDEVVIHAIKLLLFSLLFSAGSSSAQPAAQPRIPSPTSNSILASFASPPTGSSTRRFDSCFDRVSAFVSEG